MQEDLQAETHVEKKAVSSPKIKVVDEGVISETPIAQTTALVKLNPEALKSALTKIESQLANILNKQQSGVSAEFNALMDGYVNKANESQEFKVKFEQLVTQFEDTKIEFKTLKESNRKYKEDLEAAREALRASEADLQRVKKEIITNKKIYDDQFSEFTDERERLKTKVKQLTDQKDKVTNDYTQIKTEYMEIQYKVKQAEQEKQVASESAKRTVKEANKVVDELKDKLELRTREIEYKDALLNQLIKQISSEDSLAEAMKQDIKNPEQASKTFPGFVNKKDAQNGLKVKDSGSMSWGAFRK